MASDLVSPRKSDKPTRDLSPKQAARSQPTRDLSPKQAAAATMVAEAKAQGLALTGPDGLLKVFTKNVLETALAKEMTEHLGHEKNRTEPGRESTNVRNGARSKTVISDAAGEVEIEVPRDRESTCISPKLWGIGQQGDDPRIIDKVVAEMNEWANSEAWPASLYPLPRPLRGLDRGTTIRWCVFRHYSHHLLSICCRPSSCTRLSPARSTKATPPHPGPIGRR
jgi:hypothetical protein